MNVRLSQPILKWLQRGRMREWIVPAMVSLTLMGIWTSDLIQHPYRLPPGDDPYAHIQWAEDIVRYKNLSQQPFGYPPGFHIFLAGLKVITTLSFETLLIVLPLLMITVALPALIYSLVRSGSSLSVAAVATLLYAFSTKVFGDFYVGGQTPELFSLCLLLLAGIFFIQRRPVPAAVSFFFVGFSHHLTYFPALLILFLLLASLALRRWLGRDPSIRFARYAVGALFVGLLSIFVWPYYVSIALGLFTHWIPSSQTVLENASISVTNTVNASRSYSLVYPDSLAGRWMVPITVVYGLGLYFVWFWIRFRTLLRRPFSTYALQVFCWSWLLADLFFAIVTNVGGDRLVRQAAIPALLLASVGLANFFRVLPWRWGQIAAVTLVVLFLLPNYSGAITGPYAGSRYVRLNPDDMKAIEYFKEQAPVGSTILSPSIYSSLFFKYIPNAVGRQAIIKPRINNDPVHMELWKILETSDAALVEKYSVDYVFLGHATPDVNYEDQSVKDDVLLDTGHWTGVYRSGQVKIFRYQAIPRVVRTDAEKNPSSRESTLE